MRSYGALNLTVSVPAQIFAEPLTVAEAKQFLNLPARSPADSGEDSLLETLIITAREQAEILQGRDLIEKQYDLALDYFPPLYDDLSRRQIDYCNASDIELRQPLVSVDLVKYRDSTGAYTTLTEDTDYIVDTARGLLMPAYGVSWPSFTAWPSSAVLVRFTSGFALDDLFWSDAGQRILVGMRQLISLYYNERLPRQVSEEGSGNWAIDQILSLGGIRRVR